MFPSFHKSLVSSAKDENVVNPPHIPTFKNKTILGLNELFFAANAAIIPIIKHPRTFIMKVLIGNILPSFRGISPIKYLHTAPINPPMPTIIHSIIKYYPTVSNLCIFYIRIIPFSFLRVNHFTTLVKNIIKATRR